MEYLKAVLAHPDALRAFLISLVAVVALVIPGLPVSVIVGVISTGAALLSVAVGSTAVQVRKGRNGAPEDA